MLRTSYHPEDDTPKDPGVLGLALQVSALPMHVLEQHRVFLESWPQPRPWALQRRLDMTLREIERRTVRQDRGAA